MKTPILGIDIDGVLADFNFAFINLIVTLTGQDLFPDRPFDIPMWDYPQHYGYTNEQMVAAWSDIERSAYFWEQLKPYSGIKNTIELANVLPTYFVTSRMGYDVKGQTERWLRNRGVEHPTVLISSHKGLCCKALKISHYVDDRTENCESVVTDSPLTECSMVPQPWNKQLVGVPRISLATWTNVMWNTKGVK